MTGGSNSCLKKTCYVPFLGNYAGNVHFTEADIIIYVSVRNVGDIWKSQRDPTMKLIHAHLK